VSVEFVISSKVINELVSGQARNEKHHKTYRMVRKIFRNISGFFLGNMTAILY
jgi:hypothetical protein